MLQVRIRNDSYSQWTDARVTSVVGGSARPLALADPLVVIIDLTDETVTGGSFALSGTLKGYVGDSCPVSRTFQFRIENETVVVTVADELPLSGREAVRIALRSRRGRQVELEAESSAGGDSTLTWTVTAGEIVRQDGPRLSWRLPAEPGLYQAQLVVDRGPRGLSFDALALEVGVD